MDREPILKLIEIDQGCLDVCDVSAMVELCGDLEANPELVRMFQGSIAFRFPGQAERGAELWNDPGVQGWANALYERVPHLLYYADPDPALGAVALAMCGSPQIGEARISMAGSTGAERLDGLVKVLCNPLVAVAQFALRMADPWDPILQQLLDPLQPELASGVRNVVGVSVSLSGEES